MAKVLRSFIMDELGNPLIQIDFKSSHALHLVKEIKGYIYMKPPTHPPDVCTLLENEACQIERLLRQKEVGLYEYIQTMYYKEYGRSIDRKTAKEMWNKRYLNGMRPDSKDSRWIKSLFPAISRYASSLPKNHLSLRLHKSESTLLNNQIIRRISVEAPEALVYGIYDAILVNRSCFDVVYNIMLEESSAYFGFEPGVDVEELKRPVIHTIGRDDNQDQIAA
jgi:hypothetical protein